jgi:hypothetical protein
MQLNPNCSEATMRFNVTNLSEQMTKKLMKALEEIEAEHSTENGNNIPDEDAWWYDTSFYIETIFNLTTITINGDTPYNNPEKLLEALREKLKESTGFNTRLELLKAKENEMVPKEMLDIIDYCEIT